MGHFGFIFRTFPTCLSYVHIWYITISKCLDWYFYHPFSSSLIFAHVRLWSESCHHLWMICIGLHFYSDFLWLLSYISCHSIIWFLAPFSSYNSFAGVVYCRYLISLYSRSFLTVSHLSFFHRVPNFPIKSFLARQARPDCACFFLSSLFQLSSLCLSLLFCIVFASSV